MSERGSKGFGMEEGEGDERGRTGGGGGDGQRGDLKREEGERNHCISIPLGLCGSSRREGDNTWVEGGVGL